MNIVIRNDGVCMWEDKCAYQCTTPLLSLHSYYTLSIPEAGETVETPVKRYRNTGKVPIRTQKHPYPVRNYYFLLSYIHVFDKGNSEFGRK